VAGQLAERPVVARPAVARLAELVEPAARAAADSLM
jgi:hypothetical protein